MAEIVEKCRCSDVAPLNHEEGGTGIDDLLRYLEGIYRDSISRIRSPLVNHREGVNGDWRGNHINGLEGFWGYLKRKLSSKGGITRARLPLYLAEYVWRYNRRAEPERVKIGRIIRLPEQS